MTWQPLRGSKTNSPNGLPGQRGRYLILLGPPWIEGQPRWVHFSFRGESFVLRDYTEDRELRGQEKTGGVKASDVWRAVIKNIPAVGDYFHPADDIAWWKEAIARLKTE